MTFKQFFVVLMAVVFIFGSSGCGGDSSLEKAGKSANDAADSANKKIKKLMD